MLCRVLSLVFVFSILAPPGLMAQQAPTPETAALADGWARLSKGDAAGAAGAAARALAIDPLNVAAAALAIDAAFAQDGVAGGLEAYEKWLSTRRLDSAYALRRVALGLLREAAAAKASPRVRIDALRALAADGDRGALAALDEAAAAGSFNDARVLASIGNERAVQALIAQLDAAPATKAPIITALADSGSTLAIPPLRRLLTDPNDVHRAAAADALGRLGATAAIPQLRELLKDPMFPVKLEAAGALYRLNDSYGIAVLNEAAGSEHPAIRVAAARELAAQPDAAWQDLVRSLTSDPDPVVRLDAVRLIAPFDQPLAKRVLDELARDANLAVREAASDIMVDHVAADLATLRTLLRSPDARTRVKAAGRLLELTR